MSASNLIGTVGTIAPNPAAYGFAGFELKPLERAVMQAGKPVKLGARAFDVLMALIDRRDRVVSKDELFDIVWPGLVVEENNLQVQVSSLRKLFGPNVIATVPGRGYQFVSPLETEAGPASAARATPHNLPQQRTPFIGRAAELARCSQLLRDTRLLTLTGIGGSGKTRLALQLAQQQLEAFSDGVWFVDLAPLQEAERVAGPLATALGVREVAGTPLIARLAEHLADRRVLVVLDNCEHVIDAVAGLAETLLARCGELSFLVTSREGLGLAGEQIFSVRPLSLPATDDLAAMNASEAVRLFVDRARLALPDLVLDERNAAAIADICRRLDGIALALELAAARASMLSFDEIRARLDDRFRLLTGGSRSLPRQQTLRAAMQWSHDLLSPAEQRMFRQLAVFAGGWTLAAAARIADVADEYDVLELLTRLHDKSLVQVDRDAAGKPRYWMLETVRQYAQERLNESGESDVVRTRHLHYFVALAEQAASEMTGPGEGAWMARLRLEQENLMAAYAWAEHAPDAESALRLVASLRHYLANSDQIVCGYRMACSALALDGAGVGESPRAKTLLAVSKFAYFLGKYADALRYAEQALKLARLAGDADLSLTALRWLATAFYATGDHERARRYLEEVRDTARAAGKHAELSATLIGLGEIHRATGNVAQAVACYEESLALDRAAQSSRGIANGLGNLARALVLLDELERARVAALECMQVAEAAGQRATCACSLDPVAGLAESLGDSERAARYYGAANAFRRESGTLREPVDQVFIDALIARTKTALGTTAFAAAKDAGAAMTFEEAIADAQHWLARAAH
ncbi:MAG: tetratricopeptide repeat protein [Gemmatimonadota bacterium]